MQNLALFFYEIIRFIDSVLVPLIFSVAFIIFLWGVFRFFIAGGEDKEKREEGKKFVLWGVIGFVLMFSLWGIVNLIINSLGFDTQHKPMLPLFGGQAGYQQGGLFGSPAQQGGGGRTVVTNQNPIPRGSVGPACSSMFNRCPHGYDCDTNRDPKMCVNFDDD
ncbi:pilin [Patescibacteria group bacterium]|nr:pilin [Patescibacteria group bacterium]